MTTQTQLVFTTAQLHAFYTGELALSDVPTIEVEVTPELEAILALIASGALDDEDDED